jgi:hypothetical protein
VRWVERNSPSGLGVGKEDMELLNAKDVARVLKVSLPFVYKMADRGQLACVRWECPGVGEKKKTTVRFELEAVRLFIEHHRQHEVGRT